MNDFTGHVMVVGGSSGGVGREAAAQLLERGATVVLHYRSRDSHIEELTRGVPAERFMAVRADLTDRAAARRMVADIVGRFGRIDGLLSTVGTQLALEPFTEIDDDTIDTTIDVELVSVIALTQAVVREMTRTGGGRVVLVGSDSGKVGTTGECVSAACRGAIIALAKSIAREYAREGILANVVCPGPTDTDLWHQFVSRDDYAAGIGRAMARAIPLGRLGTSQEVASAGVFLLSPGASFITGQALSVSGGLTMS
ncbi:SDR family NAD(P)-dependent oxidoreductase [Streptomyces tendae]